MKKSFTALQSIVLLFWGSVLSAQTLPGTLAAPQATAPAKATISGTVTRSSSGEPILRATVTLTRVAAVPTLAATPGQRGAAPQGQSAGTTAAAQQQAVPSVTVTSDERGRFQFRDVEPGSYRLAAARNGFARQEFGQRSLSRPGTVMNVRAGQEINDVVFGLVPASTISGRVLDSNGDPLTGVTVQALRSTYDSTGKRSLQPAASTRTNDLGEYRLYWITPGRYFVNANSARSGIDLLTASASQAATQAQSPEQAQAATQAAAIFGPGANPNEVVDASLGMTYYPGTPDPSRAVALDLQPGNEIRAVDFTLVRTQRVRLTGRVVSGETGRPPQSAQVSVAPKDSSSSSMLDALIGLDPGSSRYNSATGEFTIQNVAPGSYWLQVISVGQAAQPPNQNPTPAEALAVLGSINTARIPLEVLGSDVDNLLLTVSTGGSVPGQVRVEGAQPGATVPLNGVGITLQSTSGGASILTILQGGVVRPAADGTFSIPRITSGDYKLVVNGLGTNLYLKSARFGQTDVLQNGLSISGAVEGQLEIVLGATPGQLSGAVTNADLKPAGGVQAVLIPERLRTRQDLFKTAVTDQDGRFTLRGITPGEYRLFSWEDLEPFAYFDPAVLQQYEQLGKLVRIQDAASEVADIKIIPAGTP